MFLCLKCSYVRTPPSLDTFEPTRPNNQSFKRLIINQLKKYGIRIHLFPYPLQNKQNELKMRQIVHFLYHMCQNAAVCEQQKTK